MVFAECTQLGGTGYIKEALNIIVKGVVNLEDWSNRNEMKCNKQYKFTIRHFRTETFVIMKELINFV